MGGRAGVPLTRPKVSRSFALKQLFQRTDLGQRQRQVVTWPWGLSQIESRGYSEGENEGVCRKQHERLVALRSAVSQETDATKICWRKRIVRKIYGTDPIRGLEADLCDRRCLSPAILDLA